MEEKVAEVSLGGRTTSCSSLPGHRTSVVRARGNERVETPLRLARGTRRRPQVDLQVDEEDEGEKKGRRNEEGFVRRRNDTSLG